MREQHGASARLGGGRLLRCSLNSQASPPSTLDALSTVRLPHPRHWLSWASGANYKSVNFVENRKVVQFDFFLQMDSAEPGRSNWSNSKWSNPLNLCRAVAQSFPNRRCSPRTLPSESGTTYNNLRNFPGLLLQSQGQNLALTVV